jgi:hypothetical protein
MSEYGRGFKDGLKWAVTWLHNRGHGMNDSHAKIVLHSASKHLGDEVPNCNAKPGGACRLRQEK